MDVNKTFSKRIQGLRLERNLTVEEVAANCGVHAATIYNYENGRNMPRIEIAAILAMYFGVSVDYLVGIIDEKCPDYLKYRIVAVNPAKIKWSPYETYEKGKNKND